MKLEDLISEAKESHYLTHFRCGFCSEIFITIKSGELKWKKDECYDWSKELEIEDERYLGGSIGNLVTVKEMKKEEEAIEGLDN